MGDFRMLSLNVRGLSNFKKRRCGALRMLCLHYINILKNYSPNWRWVVLGIHRAAKRRGKYPPLATDTESCNFF